jgi:hypothetical protein
MQKLICNGCKSRSPATRSGRSDSTALSRREGLRWNKSRIEVFGFKNPARGRQRCRYSNPLNFMASEHSNEMSKMELDELNVRGREWRNRDKPFRNSVLRQRFPRSWIFGPRAYLKAWDERSCEVDGPRGRVGIPTDLEIRSV